MRTKIRDLPTRNLSHTKLSIENAAAETDWAPRCNLWLEKSAKNFSRLPQRHKALAPLILIGHGIHLRVDHGALLVRNGFTHYPQAPDEYRFFPGDWRIPARIVVLDAKGAITFDALRWLSEQGIPLVQIDWRGNVLQVAGGNGFATDRQLVEAQRHSQRNGTGLKLSQRLIAEKIANSIATLRKTVPESAGVKLSLQKIELDAARIQRPVSSISDLLGIEGRVAVAYFGAWVSLPIKWTGIARRQIPPEWQRVGARGSMASGKGYRNRHATHPVNAMLNYAYAVLEHQVRAQIVGAGLDPTIGFLHGAYRDKATLVYDVMEPLRPIVDSKILGFVFKNVFGPADFTLTQQGVCRLNPQLARHIVRLVDVEAEAGETVQAVRRSL